MITLLLDFLAYRFYVYQNPESKEGTFLVNVIIKKQYICVKKGNLLKAEISIMRKTSKFAPESIRVALEIIFLDPKMNTIGKNIYSIKLKNSTVLTKEFNLQNLKSGNYIFAAKLSYQNQTKTAGAWFVVQNGK